MHVKRARWASRRQIAENLFAEFLFAEINCPIFEENFHLRIYLFSDFYLPIWQIKIRQINISEKTSSAIKFFLQINILQIDGPQNVFSAIGRSIARCMYI
jgi:hypothetical protein